MKMKFTVIILLLCVFLTSCVNIQNGDTFDYENDETFEDTFSLAGRWELVDPEEFAYSDWITAYIMIGEDDTFYVQFYGRLYGDLVRTGEFDFTITNLVLMSEGFREYPEDEAWLSYNPQTGILRYTRFNEFSEEYMHWHFERVS